MLSSGTGNGSCGSSIATSMGSADIRTFDCRLLAGGLHGPLPFRSTPWVRPPPTVLERFVSHSISPISAHPTLVRRPALDGRRECLGQDGDSRGDGRPDGHADPSAEHIANGSGDQHGKHGVDHGGSRLGGHHPLVRPWEARQFTGPPRRTLGATLRRIAFGTSAPSGPDRSTECPSRRQASGSQSPRHDRNVR